jgi:PEGA domain
MAGQGGELLDTEGNMLRRSTSLALIVTWLVFSLQGCMTIVGQKRQSVSVTAVPAGARIIVDGAYQGVPPLSLKLTKKPPHIIRIEKDGYRPVEIRLRKQKLWLPIFFGNLIWIPPIAIWGFQVDAQTPAQEFAKVFFPVLALSVSVGAMVLDGASPKSTIIEPRHISVRLEKDDGGHGPIILEWDPEEFQGVVWISVSAAGRQEVR